jgi:hypothetical protein
MKLSRRHLSLDVRCSQYDPAILNRSIYQGYLQNTSEMILNASSNICNYGITFTFTFHMRYISKLSSSLTSSRCDLFVFQQCFYLKHVVCFF